MKKGQALIVVLLILGVVATVGLSVISRSVTEVKQSTVQEESSRALNAAESGLEKFLGGQSMTYESINSVGTGSNAQFSLSTPVSIGLGQNHYQVPDLLEAGDVATLDLTSINYGGQHIRICFGQGTEAAGSEPAIVVSIYYKESGNYQVKSKGYDARSTPRAIGWENPNHGSDTCSTTTTFNHMVQINLNNDNNCNIDIGSGVPLFLRVKMAFTGGTAQPLGFQSQGVSQFGLQAGSIESVGTSGDSVQKIKAIVPNYDMPGVFDGAIFSGSQLEKLL